jgi:prevent-host-death family protein
MATKRKPSPTQAVGAAEFKAKCLELLDRVREHGEEYIVTKHGQPVARLVPIAAPRASLRQAFAGRIHVMGDIVSPDWHDDWESAR